MKWKRIAAVAVVGSAGIFALGWWKAAEPKYARKPISYWLNELRSEDDRRQQYSREVFKGMGGEATQYLLDCVRGSDSALRDFFSRWHFGVRRIDGSGAVELLPSGNLKRAMAATALGLVESNPSAVVPVLTKALEDKSSIVESHARAALIQIQRLPTAEFQTQLADVNIVDAIKAASILYSLGTNAAWIASNLTNGFVRGNLGARYDGINYLCANELEAGVAWPIILCCLNDTNLLARANALNAAIMHLSSGWRTTNWAAQAHTAIIKCFSDPDANVRGNAMAALFLYPLDPSLVPAATLKQLVNDSNPGIRQWAVGVEKELAKGIPK